MFLFTPASLPLRLDESSTNSIHLVVVTLPFIIVLITRKFNKTLASIAPLGLNTTSNSYNSESKVSASQ